MFLILYFNLFGLGEEKEEDEEEEEEEKEEEEGVMVHIVFLSLSSSLLLPSLVSSLLPLLPSSPPFPFPSSFPPPLFPSFLPSLLSHPPPQPNRYTLWPYPVIVMILEGQCWWVWQLLS